MVVAVENIGMGIIIIPKLILQVVIGIRRTISNLGNTCFIIRTYLILLSLISILCLLNVSSIIRTNRLMLFCYITCTTLYYFSIVVSTAGKPKNLPSGLVLFCCITAAGL